MALAVTVAGAIAYSSACLLTDGALAWEIRQDEYRSMAGEMAAVFGLLVLALRFSPCFLARAAGAGILLAAFLWAHRALLPVAVSGLYGAYLWEMGRCVLRKLAGGRAREGEDCLRQFLAGCVLAVCAFCLMSALGVGGIRHLWAFVLATAAMAVAGEWLAWRRKRRPRRRDEAWGGGWKRRPGAGGESGRGMQGVQTGVSLGGGRWGFGKSCLWAAVLTFFCIQAGRMNVAVDFDSLWYGVRSPYILDNGRGIYENMGLVGIVYTYSKGFEVLTLPLSVLPSYSFAIAFNLWLAAGALHLSGRIAGICAGEETRGWLICFLASLPGIMNMGITAKSDMATLFFQLMMFYEMLRHLMGEGQALWHGLGAFCFSWTLKPTALVFSTALMGMDMAFWAANGAFRDVARRERGQDGGLVSFFLSFFALLGIWARTFLITGLPVTSVFSSALTRLGFRMKYPFDAQKIPNSGAGVAKAQWARDMARRIWGVLFNPQGPDMDHVILAWGSLAVWFLMCACLVWLFLDKRERTQEEKRLDQYLHVVLAPFFACCAVSLLMLTQVDGNYFMLFYVLLSIYALRLMARLSSQKAARAVRGLAVPVILFSGVIMTLTNWSWSVGLTPVAWRHGGYYDHQARQREEMAKKGNGQIWEMLAANPRNRLIAIGEHPQALSFPCSAQSYLDITGTWGNVALVKYMDRFVEFMRYGKTDYVYAQAGYIAQEERAWSLTCDLIEYGVLVPVCFEQGNMLAEVDTEGERTKESVRRLREFLEKYERKADGA